MSMIRKSGYRFSGKIMLRPNVTGTVIAATLLIAIAAPVRAASEDDFKTAYAAAEAAEKQAADLRDRWTTTEAELAAAKKAAAAGDFDKAVAAAKEAEALAKASTFQANSEKERWKDAEIH